MLAILHGEMLQLRQGSGRVNRGFKCYIFESSKELFVLKHDQYFGNSKIYINITKLDLMSSS